MAKRYTASTFNAARRSDLERRGAWYFSQGLRGNQVRNKLKADFPNMSSAELSESYAHVRDKFLAQSRFNSADAPSKLGFYDHSFNRDIQTRFQYTARVRMGSAPAGQSAYQYVRINSNDRLSLDEIRERARRLAVSTQRGPRYPGDRSSLQGEPGEVEILAAYYRPNFPTPRG